MSPLTVWIPQKTPEPFTALLPAGIELHRLPASGDLPARLGRGEVLVAYGTDEIPAISRLEGLRVVQTLSAGGDWILDAIPPGVTLCNGSGGHDAPVAEWVVMAILAARRRLREHMESQRAATWRSSRAGGGD